MNDNDAQVYVKKVIPKDDATLGRLTKSAGKNFLFQHLEEDEKRWGKRRVCRALVQHH